MTMKARAGKKSSGRVPTTQSARPKENQTAKRKHGRGQEKNSATASLQKPVNTGQFRTAAKSVCAGLSKKPVNTGQRRNLSAMASPKTGQYRSIPVSGEIFPRWPLRKLVNTGQFRTAAKSVCEGLSPKTGQYRSIPDSGEIFPRGPLSKNRSIPVNSGQQGARTCRAKTRRAGSGPAKSSREQTIPDIFGHRYYEISPGADNSGLFRTSVLRSF